MNKDTRMPGSVTVSVDVRVMPFGRYQTQYAVNAATQAENDTGELRLLAATTAADVVVAPQPVRVLG